MKRRDFLRNGTSLTLFAGASGLASGAWAKTAWDMTNEYNENAYHTKMDRIFLAKLDELTGGELEITLHSGGSLGYKSSENFDAVGDGLVQMADTATGGLTGINPIFGVSSLPFLALTPAESQRLWETALPYFGKVFEARDQMILFANPDLPTGIWAEGQITSKADLQNLKVRTYDANGTLTMEAIGAAPVQLPFADLVPQLSTGGVSAALGSAEAGMLGGIHEYIPHFTALNYASPYHIRHVNRYEFESLPTELQDAFMASVAFIQSHIWEDQPTRLQTAYDYNLGHEMQVTPAEEVPAEMSADLREAAQVTIDRWVELSGDEGAALLEDYRG